MPKLGINLRVDRLVRNLALLWFLNILVGVLVPGMTRSVILAQVLIGSSEQRVHEQIESFMRRIISPYLEPDMYFIEVEATIAGLQTQSSDQGKKTQLPYTTLQVDMGALAKVAQESANASADGINRNVLVNEYSIRIVFDKSVPKPTQDLILGKLRKSLKIDGSARILKAEVGDVMPNIKGPDEILKLEMERLRLEKEKADFTALRSIEQARDEAGGLRRQVDDLSAERQRLVEGAQKKDNELNQVKSELDKKSSDLEQFEQSPLALIARFQSIILGLLSGVFILIGVLLLSKTVRTGSRGFADALQSGAGSLAGAVSAIASMMQQDTPEEESSQVVAKTPDAERPIQPVDRQRLEASLSLVEEKIKIMSKEGNFSFARHFADLVERKVDMAASLLVSLPEDISAKLAEALPSQGMERIQEFLESPGAYARAKSQRAESLQEFYSRIAVDEYVNSPLLKIKNTDWFLGLGSSELKDLCLRLEAKTTAALLACLSSSRVASILELSNPQERTKILDATKIMDSIDETGLADVLGVVEKTYSEMVASKKSAVRKLITSPRIFSQIIQSVSPELQKEVYDSLATREDLVEQLQRYYVPFDTVLHLSSGTLSDLFSALPAKQTAATIFGANSEIRERVLSTLPKIVMESIHEELETMDADEGAKRKNEQESIRLQAKICKVMIKLNREGLLEMAGTTGHDQAA